MSVICIYIYIYIFFGRHPGMTTPNFLPTSISPSLEPCALWHQHCPIQTSLIRCWKEINPCDPGGFQPFNEPRKKPYPPPRKLTWNLKMMVLNRNLLFQGSIFRFHVSFRGCTFFHWILVDDILVGGWFPNPSEKYYIVKLDHFPK